MNAEEVPTQQVKKSPNLFGRSLNLKMFANNSAGQSPFPFSRKNKTMQKTSLPAEMSSPIVRSQGFLSEKPRKKMFRLTFGFNGKSNHNSRSEGLHSFTEISVPEDPNFLEIKSDFPGNGDAPENSPQISNDKKSKKHKTSFLSVGWSKSKGSSSSTHDILATTISDDDVISKKDSNLSEGGSPHERVQVSRMGDNDCSTCLLY